jgi:uncharacterized protein (TIGR00369 family)
MDPAQLQRIGQLILASPHGRALGFKMVDIGDARAEVRLPYAAHIVGDPETRVLAGGALTALLDHTCGMAVTAALEDLAWVATLDLRIDYMRPAPPDHDVRARAHCYKLTRTIAFVRAVAFIDDPDDPVAAASGAFIITPQGGGAPT